MPTETPSPQPEAQQKPPKSRLVERHQPAKYALLSLDHVLPPARAALAPVQHLENEAAKQVPKQKPYFSPTFCQQQIPKLQAVLPNAERYARAAKAGNAPEYPAIRDLVEEIKAQINLLQAALG